MVYNCQIKLTMFQLLILIFISSQNIVADSKPNVIFIMADDYGWNDVSFHGSDQILTPNIDALAYHGVILNKFYTPPMCTPSRASLLTGKYSHKIGMQHYVIPNDAPFGLGLDQKLMPEYFKEAGYSTHLIGKWHLGFYQRQYVPTERGYDTFFGYYGSYIDYFNFNLKMFDKPYARGHDLRRNLEPFYDIPPDTYATDLFTKEAVDIIKGHDYGNPLFLFISHLAPHSGNDDAPLQAPQSEIDKFRHIKDENRRILAAMISKLDSSVGEVVEALKKANVLQNSVIVFISDNGGKTVDMHANHASNHPLKGQKNSPWEGALRNIALVYSPLIQNNHRVCNELFDITDFLATFSHLAGFTVPFDIDGINQWETVNKGSSSSRKEILHVTDPIFGFSALTKGAFKLVNGTTSNGEFDGWLGKIGETILDPNVYAQRILSSKTNKILTKHGATLTENMIHNMRKQSIVYCTAKVPDIEKDFNCYPLEHPCLFNILNDPCELYNLAEVHTGVLNELLQRLDEHIENSIEPRNKPKDPNCDPANFNFTWNWWQSEKIEL